MILKFNLVLTLLYVYVRYATEAIQLHVHHITLSTTLSHVHKLQVKRNKIYVCMYVYSYLMVHVILRREGNCIQSVPNMMAARGIHRTKL